jgi:hypothetical protein
MTKGTESADKMMRSAVVIAMDPWRRVP